MKLIHCADIHLDSKMEANLDSEQAKKRKAELLNTFHRMVVYASEQKISGILISGDLFDKKNISQTCRNTVLADIRTNPDISFFILKGNHDNSNLLTGEDEIPKNLFLFSDKWSSYKIGDNTTISGVELNKDNSGRIYNELLLDDRNFNIVMLHGQEAESSGKNDAEVINLKALRGKNINYLALGHIHKYKLEDLTNGVKYCYPGCLEGRGFDECGEHGFVVLDIDDKCGQCSIEFIPFAQRKMFHITVELQNEITTPIAIKEVENKLQEEKPSVEDLVKIELLGAISPESEIDEEIIRSRLSDRFFFVKIKNSTTMKINEEDYICDKSLKGEFVRLVMSDTTMSEEDKAMVISFGLNALKVRR